MCTVSTGRYEEQIDSFLQFSFSLIVDIDEIVDEMLLTMMMMMLMIMIAACVCSCTLLPVVATLESCSC